MTAPAAPKPYVSIGEGRGARAAHYTLEAFYASRADLYPDHSICGYSCRCRQRPKGWSNNPPIHPRYEECHP